MTTIQIKIEGEPIAKARPRFYRRGKHVGTYNSQEDLEDLWLLQAMPQIAKGTSLGAMMLKLMFYMPRPKSHFGTGRNAKRLRPSAPYFHTKKPDLDNLTKFAMDCMNKLPGFPDDAHVVRLEAVKKYTPEGPGMTIIEIIEVV